MSPKDCVILSGSSNRSLAQKITEKLNQPLGKIDIRRFQDGEIFVEIQENVRGRNVYVIQSTSIPVNETLMELLITMDALKRASAKEITAVMPYYGYARQDRKIAPRTPISAKLVADLLTTAGATRILSMDLHAGQIQGFFNIPFDNLYASSVLSENFKTNSKIPWIVVSPDAGGVERARFFAKKLNASVAVIDKRRSAPNVAHAMHVIGDVKGFRAIILDDLIDTAGTLLEATGALLNSGAKEVYAAATHGVFSGDAISRVEKSPLKKVFITDTLEQKSLSSKIHVVSLASLLAEAIHRIHHHESVSDLFLS
jgi:ribose-phosphate pyrophosphokinase